MSHRVLNVLRAERERRGWSQARMAEAAGISRQSYAAIESGGAVPSTEVSLRLAQALGRPVEKLFRLPDLPLQRSAVAWAGPGEAAPGARIRIVQVGGRSTGHAVGRAQLPDGPADALVESVADTEVQVRHLPDVPSRGELAVTGCDPAFGIVASALHRDRDVEAVWSLRGSRAALECLARGHVHVAGCHLLDSATGEWNGPWIRRLVPFPVTRIRFAVWEQTLLVRGGADRIRAVGDLARPGVRVLNREEGSGSRMLLDEVLASAGVDAGALAGYGTSAPGHHAVAEGVAAGCADAGVATRAAGASRGLTGIPLRRESYELVVPDHFLDLPAVQALLDTLRRPGIRSQVEALPGYEVEGMGLPT